MQDWIRKEMDDRALGLWVTAMYWCKHYHDANPDVGWGPSVDDIIKQIEDESGDFMLDDEKTLVKDAFLEHNKGYR